MHYRETCSCSQIRPVSSYWSNHDNAAFFITKKNESIYIAHEYRNIKNNRITQNDSNKLQLFIIFILSMRWKSETRC